MGFGYLQETAGWVSLEMSNDSYSRLLKTGQFMCYKSGQVYLLLTVADTVTGDKGLLDIGQIENLAILSPRQLWEQLKTQPQRGVGRGKPRRSR